jgi:hypothetical protein
MRSDQAKQSKIISKAKKSEAAATLSLCAFSFLMVSFWLVGSLC